MELLSYLLKSSLCLGVFVGLYAVLLRRETFYVAVRGYFGLALVVSLGLPLVKVPAWPAAGLPGTDQSAARYLPDLSFRFDRPAATEVVPLADGGTSAKPFAAGPLAAGPLEEVLLLGYGLGVAALLGRLGYQLGGLARLRRRARSVWVQGQRVWVPAGPAQPFSFFNSIFLNPAQYSEPELDEILRHERVHVRQGHSVDVLAAELLTIGFWFNPLAWLFRAYLRQNLEFLTDQCVLRSGVDARRYQFSLLKWGGVPVPSPVANGFSVPQLKNRIRQINTPASPRWRVLKMGLVVPLVGVLGMGFVPRSIPVLRSLKGQVVSVPPIKPVDLVTTRTDSQPVARKKPLILIDTADGSEPSFRIDYQTDGTAVIQTPFRDSIPAGMNTNASHPSITLEGGKNAIRFVGKPQPLMILDGQLMREGTRLESIETDDIISVDVFKPTHPVTLEYGERGKNGVIKITTRKKEVQNDTLPAPGLPEVQIRHLEGSGSKFSKLKEENVVFVVDGVEVKNFEGFKPNQIESVEVLKGEKATERYGDRAKDGVILVRLKKK